MIPEPDDRNRSTGWIVTGALALAALVIMGVGWAISSAGRGEAGPGPEELAVRMDINQAGRSELELLPGVGASRATRILRARQRRGGFKSLQELDEKGVLGPGSSERLRKYLLPIEQSGKADLQEGAP